MLTKKIYLDLIPSYGTRCLFCGKKNHPYMVTDKLWNKIINSEGCVCIPCFENRLGRSLKKKDFIDAPINKFVFGFDSNFYLSLKD